jgi:hypothetical protein
MPKADVKIVRMESSMRAEEHLSRTRGGRKILAHEKAVAEDIAQLLDFEIGFSKSPLGQGHPSMAVLVASWRRARDSWERILKALPSDALLHAEMQRELWERDAAMNLLADRAEELLEEAEDVQQGHTGQTN